MTGVFFSQRARLEWQLSSINKARTTTELIGNDRSCVSYNLILFSESNILLSQSNTYRTMNPKENLQNASKFTFLQVSKVFSRQLVKSFEEYMNNSFQRYSCSSAFYVYCSFSTYFVFIRVWTKKIPLKKYRYLSHYDFWFYNGDFKHWIFINSANLELCVHIVDILNREMQCNLGVTRVYCYFIVILLLDSQNLYKRKFEKNIR